MSKNIIKFNNNLQNSVQLIMEGEEYDEAFASISLNPTLTWVKFVLTDDQPNGNKQRIPKEEFANLIRTGIHMPIKMAFGEIKQGHQDAFALGTITHLKEVGNQIQGLAGLWSRERPEDVDFIRNKFDKAQMGGNGKVVPQLSWETMYTESTWGFEGDEEVENLHGTALRGVTFVGLPAYEGRTPILAVASEDMRKKYEEAIKDKPLKEKLEILSAMREEAEAEGEQAYIDELVNLIESIEGEINMEELEKDLKEAREQIAELETKLAELEPQLDELTELREYKEQIEAEKAEAAKFDAIKQKFADSEIEKDDEYFAEKRDMLLALSEEQLDFFIQELIAFSAESQSSDDEEDEEEIPEVPSLQGKSGKNYSAKELANTFRADLTK